TNFPNPKTTTMTTLIAFAVGLAGAALGLYIYHSGKLEGRREQIESSENQRKLHESLSLANFEAAMRKAKEEVQKQD
ncbi:hypothetical protein, partial [Fibrobacter sp.]|uniref:hypothetical protein n=1 Tax=Fibrobacter sp. TaxID=35828 RepID=UPI0025B935C3